MAQILIALKNQKRVGYFLFFHSQNCLMKTKGSHITHNVKRLCAGGDLAVQMLNLVQKPIRITGVQFIPNAPLAQNRC